MKLQWKVMFPGLLCVLWVSAIHAKSAEDAWHGLVGEKFSSRPEFAYVENDPNLPNVLIYGDSISIGYTQRVREKLKGQANIYRLHLNGGDSGTFIHKMDVMHDTMRDETLDRPWTFQWDVIHFNVGLHDLKYITDKKKLDKQNGSQVSSVGTYRQNMHDIVAYLEQHAPGVKLVFATTTPVPEGEPGRFAGDAEKYNQVALEVMRDYPQIGVNDLYTFTLPNQKAWWTKPGNVHFNDTGKDAQGDEVARILAEELDRTKSQISCSSSPMTRPGIRWVNAIPAA